MKEFLDSLSRFIGTFEMLFIIGIVVGFQGYSPVDFVWNWDAHISQLTIGRGFASIAP